MSSAVFRSGLGLRRRVLLLTYTAVLLVVMSATIIFVVLILSNQHDALADRTAETADVVAGSTLLLAFIAALIALQAYAAVTGLPSLKIQLRFSGGTKMLQSFAPR